MPIVPLVGPASYLSARVKASQSSSPKESVLQPAPFFGFAPVDSILATNLCCGRLPQTPATDSWHGLLLRILVVKFKWVLNSLLRDPHAIMNKHCHQCGTVWSRSIQPGRGERCPRCKADLRVCLNCAWYDPLVAQQCRERRAEPVFEKDLGNYCEYFELCTREYKKPSDSPREENARDALKRLFGD